jgi:hypothetical protein
MLEAPATAAPVAAATFNRRRRLTRRRGACRSRVDCWSDGPRESDIGVVPLSMTPCYPASCSAASLAERAWPRPRPPCCFDSENVSDVATRKPDPWFCRPVCVLALICRLARGRHRACISRVAWPHRSSRLERPSLSCPYPSDACDLKVIGARRGYGCATARRG